MVLSERGMQMAKELAREFVRAEREKQRRRFEELFIHVKNTVMKVWKIIKNTWENAVKTLYDLDKREIERSKWHVPIKTEAPPMPDIRVPKLYNARSNI